MELRLSTPGGEIAVGSLELNDQGAAFLTSEAVAGRHVFLVSGIETRADGTHLLHSTIVGMPTAPIDPPAIAVVPAEAPAETVPEV